MNKQELVDRAVHERNGVLGDGNANAQFIVLENGEFYALTRKYINSRSDISSDQIVCTVEEFQQRARELGYVNGYRWGVEYPTNGKKPNLPDDVVVSVSSGSFAIDALSDAKIDEWRWGSSISFKITDTRYKPEDTSYLETPALEPAPEEEGWYDYTTQKALRLPPVGVDVETCNPDQLLYGAGESGEVLAHVENTAVIRMSYGLGCFCADNLRPMDWNRKAEAERKLVVDAAYDRGYAGVTKGVLFAMFDDGFLRMPEWK